MQIKKGILHWQNCSSKLSLSLINNNLILLIMIDLFFMGGPLFMGLLTIIFVLLIVAILMEFKGKSQFYSLSLIKEIGILALVVGLFGQLIGLYQMFGVVEQIGDISPTLLIGGLKVSLISTLYGLLILIIAYSYTIIHKKISTES